MQVGLQPRELEAKALHGKAKEVCSYAKKEKRKRKKKQGNLGARKVVSFHSELQHWNNATERQSNTQHMQHASRGLGNMQLRLKGWLLSLTLSEMERFSAFFSCHLEILIFLI